MIVLDPDLLRPDSTIILYTQLQPCHHSGDDDTQSDSRSCTERLLEWYEQEFQPRNITLSIECARLYKVMWQAETSDPEQTAGSEFSYHRSVQNARQGVQLIREAGIQMQMITEDG